MNKHIKFHTWEFTFVSMIHILFLIALFVIPCTSLAQGSFTVKAPRATARLAMGTAEVDGKICAIGRLKTETVPLSVVEVYDPVTDSWDTFKTPMSEKKYSHSKSVINGKIYAFGGWRGSGSGPIYKTVEEYDPVADVWIRKIDMPVRVAELSTVAPGMKIYLIGGTSTLHLFTSVANVYEYDPLSDFTSVEDVFARQPSQFSLHQNYPNPFNPETMIEYSMQQPSCVTLKIYNTMKQMVRHLSMIIKIQENIQ
ncbi:Kelch repeat-containing protein [bacterium]